MVIKGSIELLRKRLSQDPRALHLLDNAQQVNRGIIDATCCFHTGRN